MSEFVRRICSASESYDQVVPYRAREDVAFFVEVAEKIGGPGFEVVRLSARSSSHGALSVPFMSSLVTRITGMDQSTRVSDTRRGKIGTTTR
jgi:hypothetical protein